MLNLWGATLMLISNGSMAVDHTSIPNSLYDFGKGVTENNTEAIKWYRLAAEQGNVDAQFSISNMHDLGEGVADNDRAAVK